MELFLYLPKAILMLELNINNETSRLKAVVLGSAFSSGPTPKIEEAYDPKSLEHILAGTYPVEVDMVSEIKYFTRQRTRIRSNSVYC